MADPYNDTNDARPGDAKAQGLDDIVSEGAQLAPNGVSWESWRQSENVDDIRPKTIDDIVSGSKYDDPAYIDQIIDEAAKDAPTDTQPSSVLGGFYRMLTGQYSWMEDPTTKEQVLRPKYQANLVNSVGDYVTSGRLGKEIQDYHNSDEYKRRVAENEKDNEALLTAFQKDLDRVFHKKFDQ